MNFVQVPTKQSWCDGDIEVDITLKDCIFQDSTSSLSTVSTGAETSTALLDYWTPIFQNYSVDSLGGGVAVNFPCDYAPTEYEYNFAVYIGNCTFESCKADISRKKECIRGQGGGGVYILAPSLDESLVSMWDTHFNDCR